jgi:heme/copper-type cytochrome/quinol oxidase subunit 2
VEISAEVMMMMMRVVVVVVVLVVAGIMILILIVMARQWKNVEDQSRRQYSMMKLPWKQPYALLVVPMIDGPSWRSSCLSKTMYPRNS